jgi:hypothetical protein
VTRALADWGHSKLVLSVGRVRSIRPVRNESGTLVYCDEHRGEPCACCGGAPSTVVQLCECRLLFCAACSYKMLSTKDRVGNNHRLGHCMLCYTAIQGTHQLHAGYKWPGTWTPAPDDMCHTDAQRRFSLPVAYSYIGIRERGELVTYRLRQLAEPQNLDAMFAGRGGGGGSGVLGECGAGISAFATAQDTLRYLPHFDIPEWARAMPRPIPSSPLPPSSTSSSSSASSSSSSSSPSLPLSSASESSSSSSSPPPAV